MANLYDGLGNIFEIQSGATSGNDFLTGKTWLCVGDSISTYAGYRQMIVDKYKLNALIGAFQGGMRVGYGAGKESCILEKLDSISAGTPDIITIALGTNDNGSDIGNITDDPNTQTESNFTFIGCYKALITRLFNKYGYVPMMLMTPYQRNKVNVTNIVKAIKEIGAYYSIPVFDVYEESGLPLGTLTDTDDENRLFAPDGLHINPYGGSISAPRIADKMNLIIQKWEFPPTKLVGSGSTNITLTDTYEKKIYAYVLPNYSTDFNKIVWESSNDNVAIVDRNPDFTSAQLKAIANGSCTITARLNDFEVLYNVTVNI